MPPAAFEPETPESEWPQTYALDLMASGIGNNQLIVILIF